MDNPLLAHVGARIRLYRKTSGLSSQALAGKVGKSKASISKYETGKTVLDIETLFSIAAALGVAPARLFDYEPPGHVPAAAGKSPFGDTRRLYMYHLTAGRVYVSVLELGEEAEGRAPATLFYKADGANAPTKCACIYHGQALYHDFVVSLILQNAHNPAEQVLMNTTVPLQRTQLLTGMLSGLGVGTLLPTAHKTALSKTLLPVDDGLRALLTLSPESFKEMRRKNTLFIPLG